MKHTQTTLSPVEKKARKPLSASQRQHNIEKKKAHIAFKLLKSLKFKSFTQEQISLLKKYYGISL
jgi:hypothetical protein